MVPALRARLLEAERHRSVTAQLFARSLAPLLTWPEHMRDDAPHTFRETVNSLVIVPLDGSTLGEQALPVAESFARAYERTLLLVRLEQRTPHEAVARQQLGSLHPQLHSVLTRFAAFAALLRSPPGDPDASQHLTEWMQQARSTPTSRSSPPKRACSASSTPCK